MLIEIAIAALSIGAFLDGASTDFAIKRGNVEVDPIMLKIFGTNKPTAKTIFLRGAAVIATEAFAALTVCHYHHSAILFVGLVLLAQSAVHVLAATKNFETRAAS